MPGIQFLFLRTGCAVPEPHNPRGARRDLELHVQSGEEEEVGIWACHSGYARKETFLGVAVGARRRKNLSPSCWNLQLVRRA